MPSPGKRMSVRSTVSKKSESPDPRRDNDDNTPTGRSEVDGEVLGASRFGKQKSSVMASSLRDSTGSPSRKRSNSVVAQLIRDRGNKDILKQVDKN